MKTGRICIADVLSTGRDAPGQARSAYLHVPFCFHKCHYCDFYSIVDNRDRQGQFTHRLIADLRAAAAWLAPQMETIFIGGGTPTLLAVEHWETLLAALKQTLPLEPGGEFTVEANPETVTPELADVLVRGGVNRISIGCQSFNPTHLKSLERWHDPANVHRSVQILREAGVENINLDLIFAIPGQTFDEWLADLAEALSLNPTHLSCYGLVYEPNTPLTVKMRSGQISPCEQELEAAMYEATIQRLRSAGFEHYEISNWVKQNEEVKRCRSEEVTAFGSHHRSSTSLAVHSWRCRHNLAYWTNRNWWALGPSASGHMNGVRWKNVPRLGEYLEPSWCDGLPPIVDVERVDEDACIGEQFMLGLRMIDGMEWDRVEELLSHGTRGSQRRQVIERHVQTGLLARHGGRLRLHKDGLLLADSVLAELI